MVEKVLNEQMISELSELRYIKVSDVFKSMSFITFADLSNKLVTKPGGYLVFNPLGQLTGVIVVHDSNIKEVTLKDVVIKDQP